MARLTEEYEQYIRRATTDQLRAMSEPPYDHEIRVAARAEANRRAHKKQRRPDGGR